jgi:type IV secretory pathway VirB2 component (pilin)
MIPPKLFPVVLICLQAAASAVYAGHGDWRRCIYWIAGAVITAAVTF